MSYQKIESVLRSGIWISHYDRYFKAAVNALEDLLKGEQELSSARQVLESQGADPNYIIYKTSDNLERLEVLSATVEIYCCMSVEAFLNDYGVKRLGEEFYKRNYERLGITQKLETLLATCQQILLPKKVEVSQIARKMFDRRNMLVHPKARDITESLFNELAEQSIDIIVEAQERVEEMKRFYSLFAEYDPETKPLIPSLSRVDEA